VRTVYQLQKYYNTTDACGVCMRKLAHAGVQMRH
jgi:hypothetical protein